MHEHPSGAEDLRGAALAGRLPARAHGGLARKIGWAQAEAAKFMTVTTSGRKQEQGEEEEL